MDVLRCDAAFIWTVIWEASPPHVTKCSGKSCLRNAQVQAQDEKLPLPHKKKQTNLTLNTKCQCFKNNYVIYFYNLLQSSTESPNLRQFVQLWRATKSYKVLVKAESGVLPLTAADTGQQDQQELRSSMKSHEVIMSRINDWLMNG